MGGLSRQADGKLVLASYYWSGGNPQFQITRHNADGTYDRDFTFYNCTIVRTMV
ncbi:MAG: hypothetical protein ACHRHE_19555 [Tepidisphaerales bacterium]